MLFRPQCQIVVTQGGSMYKLAMGEKADPCSLFRLTVTNDGQMLIKMYIKLDLSSFGLKV